LGWKIEERWSSMGYVVVVEDCETKPVNLCCHKYIHVRSRIVVLEEENLLHVRMNSFKNVPSVFAAFQHNIQSTW
jgi:hypothetical protein